MSDNLPPVLGAWVAYLGAMGDVAITAVDQVKLLGARHGLLGHRARKRPGGRGDTADHHVCETCGVGE